MNNTDSLLVMLLLSVTVKVAVYEPEDENVWFTILVGPLDVFPSPKLKVYVVMVAPDCVGYDKEPSKETVNVLSVVTTKSATGEECSLVTSM